MMLVIDDEGFYVFQRSSSFPARRFAVKKLFLNAVSNGFSISTTKSRNQVR